MIDGHAIVYPTRTQLRQEQLGDVVGAPRIPYDEARTLAECALDLRGIMLIELGLR